MLSPIVLFAYNRPISTANLLNSLAANSESRDSLLYIFCDGPKSNASEDECERISKVRLLVKMESRFKEIIIFESCVNKGLAKSVLEGVTKVINQHGKVIVVEDDLIVSKFFLLYMNDSLDRYETQKRVGQIGACNFFACDSRFPKTFFTAIPDCLGWATWADRWEAFDTDPLALLQKLQKSGLTNRFNVYDSYDMMKMLEMQIEGKVDSWAIRWQAVCVLNNWLTLYPNPSFSNHIASTEATHANINILPPLCMAKPKFYTQKVKENRRVIAAMREGYKKIGAIGNINKTSKKSSVRSIIEFVSKRKYLKWASRVI